MQAASESIPIWLGAVLTIIGICGMMGTALACSAFFKSVKNKTQLELMALSNSELQRTVQWERTECDRKLAEVRAEVHFFKNGAVEALATAVSIAVVEHMSTSVSAMRRSTDEPKTQQMDAGPSL